MVEFRSDMKVELIDFMGGDGRVVQAARTSTLGAAASEEKELAGLIGFLADDRHTVPFEHSVFTFRIEAPIFVTRQILKHRITSISEESGRYRELEGVFYIPDGDRPLVQVGKTGEYNFEPGSSGQRVVVEDIMMHLASGVWTDYQHLLGIGIAKEVARMILPLNLYSSLYLTLNAHSLFNFLSLRNEHHAQYEIREVARKMQELFEDKMPISTKAWDD